VTQHFLIYVAQFKPSQVMQLQASLKHDKRWMNFVQNNVPERPISQANYFRKGPPAARWLKKLNGSNEPVSLHLCCQHLERQSRNLPIPFKGSRLR